MTEHVIVYWKYKYDTKHGYRWRVLSRRKYYQYTGKILAGGNW